MEEVTTRQPETPARHTAGPWRCEPQPGQTVGKHTYTHCVMYGDDSIADTLTEPDARLIAAAPDLLAACEQIARMLGTLKDPTADEKAAISIAKRAIAKAKGGGQ